MRRACRLLSETRSSAPAAWTKLNGWPSASSQTVVKRFSRQPKLVLEAPRTSISVLFVARLELAEVTFPTVRARVH